MIHEEIDINRYRSRCDVKNTHKAAVVFYKRDAELKRDWGDLDAIKSQCKQTDFFLYDIVGDIHKEVVVTGFLHSSPSKRTSLPLKERVIKLSFKGDISKKDFSNYDFTILVDNETTVVAYYYRFHKQMSFSHNKKKDINILKVVAVGGTQESIIIEK